MAAVEEQKQGKQEVRQGQGPLDLKVFLDGLLADARITQADCDNAIKHRHDADHRGKHILHYLSDLEIADQQNPGRKLDVESLTMALSAQCGQDYFRIDPLKIDVAQVTKVMDYKFSQRHQILAVADNPQEVIIASAEPYLDAWVSVLSHTSGKLVKRVVSNPHDIKRLTSEFYSVSKSIQGATQGASQLKGIGNLEQMLELGKLKDPEANDQHIVNVVDWLLQYAFEQRASDIHIEPRREKGNVRFRIDGVLYTVYALPMTALSAVTSRLKILGRMNVAEKRKPQDGRIKTKSPNGDEVELRLSTLPTAFGEKLVMRIFDPEVLLKPFEALGLVNDDLKRWNQITSNNHGIVVITGPTGSGKTTTLYSSLTELNDIKDKLITTEDPVEYDIDGIVQIPIDSDVGVTFASCLRAILRQDPDTILVGEVRDLETAEIAIQAALTGHLVFSTLHTNDAPATVTRLKDMGIQPFMICATVEAILAQRLVRRVCTKCREEAKVTSNMLFDLGMKEEDIQGKTFYKGTGCDNCNNTGYKGRIALFELMVMNDTLREMVMTNASTDELRDEAQKFGMVPLREFGIAVASDGITTLDEVIRETVQE